MPECDACIELSGKPTSQEPHDGLTRMHTAVHPDGDLITYACLRCRTQWQRFKPNATLDGRPHYWASL